MSRARRVSPLGRGWPPCAALGLAACLLGSGLEAQAPADAPRFTVRYRSASSAYIDGGKADGLAVGDRLAVRQGGEDVAQLEVSFLAERSASCRVVSETRAVRAGDAATLVARADPAASEPKAQVEAEGPRWPSAPPRSRAGPRPWARARGALALALYKVADGGPALPGSEQRLGRADLVLTEIGGQPLSLNARLRSRRDAGPPSAGSNPLARRDHLYELSLRYAPPGDSVSLEVGRLRSSLSTSIDFLDGALLRVRVDSALQVGAFAGRRADVDGLGSDGGGAKHGGFLRVSPRAPQAVSYDVVLAFVRELARSEVSREFLGIEARLGSQRVRFFGRSEIDLNRGWRRTLATQDYQLSNLALAASLRLTPSATVALSYDSFRRYRDHGTRDVPERFFDDLRRRGLRASLVVGRGFGWSANAGLGVRRAEAGEPASYSLEGGVRHNDFMALGLTIGCDLTAFRNATTDGHLVTGHVGKRFGAGHQLALGYGRSRYRPRPEGPARRSEYLRLSGRGGLGRHVFLLADLEYGRGDDLAGPRGFVEIGVQF
jgi:hypothetical protein